MDEASLTTRRWGERVTAKGSKKRKPARATTKLGYNERHAKSGISAPCLLYTSDAADDLLCVDLGGRRIIKKNKTETNQWEYVGESTETTNSVIDQHGTREWTTRRE
mgnify:CR=1 FL=1